MPEKLKIPNNKKNLGYKPNGTIRRDNMDLKRCSYGVMEKNELVYDIGPKQSQRTVCLGTVVKVETVCGTNCHMKFLKDDSKTWESICFLCPMQHIICIDEKAWRFVTAIASPQERVKLAKHQRLQRLLQIKKEDTIGYNTDGDILVGVIKYIGEVKGIGMCYGIQLAERKEGNSCNGSIGDTQYFSCFKGYGIFATIDKIVVCGSKARPNDNDLDRSIQNNIANFSSSNGSLKVPNSISRKDTPSKANLSGNNHSTYFKSSHSMQNIADENSINTNNDFDQNSILQPDRTQLITKSEKRKQEMELSEVYGNTWTGATDTTTLKAFSDFSKLQNNQQPVSNTLKSNKEYIINELSGSKTVPKKTNNHHRIDKLAFKSYPTSTFYVDNPSELNERIAKESKKLPSPSTSHQHHNNGIEDEHEEAPGTVYHDVHPSESNELVVGSVVEVSNDVCDKPLYGVVRWMGKHATSNFVLVGVELEEALDLPLELTDGTHTGQRFFTCGTGRALFVPLTRCHKDSRFQDGIPTPVHSITEKTSDLLCPVIQGEVPPIIMTSDEDVKAVCGKFKGIQGHHNSCYLDATLFAMFTYTSVFDSLMYRPKGPNDIDRYEEVQRVLKEEIVNPLRKNLFVRADRVMTLRKLLDQLSSVSGLTSEEKDPEEFLNSLLAQILKAEPFLKLNSGQDAYYYQLFVEKDDELKLPTVQHLFDQSFLTSDIKLKEVPSCLIVQMPRFGKNYKMYPRILPSQLLDITDIIENSPRQCTVCGKLAVCECRDCFGGTGIGFSLESTTFCAKCLETTHKHEKRRDHQPKHLSVPHDFLMMAEHCSPPRLFMDLFAVICIETSHYVAFVKCGVGQEAPWCFFDSMADRKGERNGYNIPEMVACPEVSQWLADEQSGRSLHDISPHDRHLPEYARRLLCDAYICMYQSSDVMMYR